MSFVKGLRCRECGREYPKEPIYVCEFCFGSLEVDYDYERMRQSVSRQIVESRPLNLWRYRELLPIDGEPTVGLHSGCTPLVRADHLAAELGIREAYVKDDSTCHPTLSFKDRVVAVALSKAREFGFDTVACASTGNLANSVSAHAAAARLKRYVFIPADLELGKVVSSLVYAPRVVAVEGTYDDVNRLCAEVAGKYRWGFVNINLRPYYAEGSKTMAFEVAEQLGWRAPAHVVVPAASGSLATKIWKGLKELHRMGLIPEVATRVHVAQAEGCSPIATAFRSGTDIIKPVKPRTIAKSLAIGNPADGYYAIDMLKECGGVAEAVTDEEIVEGIKLLARTEGIFTETAGGVTVAVTAKLVQQGVIPRNETVVICVTGNGLKTQEAVAREIGEPVHIQPSLKSFEKALEGDLAQVNV